MRCENCDKVSFVSFQPVSFTGRDEEINDESGTRKRYTLSHLAEDMRRQTGVTEPLRDWFPLSASSVMSHVTDLMKGPGADWGSLKCGCHPNCGVGMGFMVSKKTKEWAPLSAFVNVEQVLKDAQVITDSARGQALTVVQTALSLLRNYRPTKAPAGFRLIDLLHKFDKQSGGHLGGSSARATTTIARATNGCCCSSPACGSRICGPTISAAPRCASSRMRTQMGEISFCAYNTGVGWRQIVENMYQNAKVADWYRAHGKHAVYANPNKAVPLPANSRPVALHIPKDGRLVEWSPKPLAPAPGPARTGDVDHPR